MSYSSFRKMFEEEVCVCTTCLDFPLGSAAAHKNDIQDSVLMTRYLSNNLRAMEMSHTLFEERPLSAYKVTPLVRLEEEWLRADASGCWSTGATTA